MASYLQSASSYLVAQLDARVANQETREQFYKNAVIFSRQQPFFSSFLAVQLLFGALPILGMMGFALGVSALAVGFVTFWIGVGICVMFSVLAVTATIATCVWGSAAASLIFFKCVFAVFSGNSADPKKILKAETYSERRRKETGHIVSAARADKNGNHNQKENQARTVDDTDEPVKLDGDGISQKSYEEDTEGSDDTIGSYTGSAPNRYTNRVKSEDLEWVQPSNPMPLSDAEKMRRDIERSLK